MPACLQCGNCCLGLEWTFTFDGKDEDPANLSFEIIKKAERRLRFYGLLFHDFRRAEKKDDKVSLTYKVGACQHLKHDGKKAHCTIHENRPYACRNYFCGKAKD